MSDLPLFYSSVVPLDSQAHRSHRIATAQAPFAFAAGAHLIPAVVDEFAAAAREIPVVFAPAGTRYAAVFLCGLKPQSNLFVDAQGRWTGTYLPAYLRRYPFILGERQGGDPLVCVDTGFAGFAPDEDGQALFDAEGKATPALNAMVKLVTDYATSAKRTELLGSKLQEFDLLRSVTIDVQGANGPSASIHGLSIVDEAKFAALPDAALLELRRLNLLGAIYAHLFSVGATQTLSAKLKANEATAAETGADAYDKSAA
ncbi:SapC family protein [Ancylobacter sp. WKF20]|uniref:SapC family protein n=1 Tax=Ancylobacter sp. WKF20 TaxID=3039801 RepID=UPI0024341243|nr:SapC family protein [Ancylobacter sp. WKF20]WGD30996.1 SapC family protein [Ancylobacter sp. WKF20]